MNCFNHNNVAGNAICKYCGKAICVNCISIVGERVCCKNSCENEMEKANNFSILSMQSVNKTSTAFKRSSIFSGLMGVIFILIGAVPYILAGDKGNLFFSAMGAVFLISAMYSFKTGKSYAKDTRA